MIPSIVPIVEGHSEVKSVPVLMRRFLQLHGIYDVVIEKPIRIKRQQIIKEGQLERAIARALLRPNCRAIVIILDADDDCPKELAPSLLKGAQKVSPSTVVSVVLPKSEFESWFLGSIESLHGVRGISDTATSPSDVEALRDAKGQLTNIMEGRRVYIEVDDQPAFAATFDFKLAYENCRSFRKFQKDFEAIMASLSEMHTKGR
ncbi:DUF4276 family protein [Candidatus Poribacteria bacterium]|nr:DUF4276 family protein [Candidatus Poribacteria bacterium]